MIKKKSTKFEYKYKSVIISSRVIIIIILSSSTFSSIVCLFSLVFIIVYNNLLNLLFFKYIYIYISKQNLNICYLY